VTGVEQPRHEVETVGALDPLGDVAEVQLAPLAEDLREGALSRVDPVLLAGDEQPVAAVVPP